MPRGTLDGKVRIHATLSASHETEKGHVQLALNDATIGPVGGVTLALTGDLDDHAVSGKSTGQIAGLGSFTTSWDGVVDGSIRSPKTWRDATGTADVRIEGVKLELLNALLPKDSPMDSAWAARRRRISCSIERRRAPRSRTPS